MERPDVSDLLNEWEEFYKNLFGLNVLLRRLVIPDTKQGFNRLIVVVPRLGPEELCRKCEDLFSVRRRIPGKLNKVISSERTAENGAYAVWVRDVVEAVKADCYREFENMSAEDLRRKNKIFITLEERILLELWELWRTRGHLDLISTTLCVGSRLSLIHI